MAEGARLESVYTATYRGFESPPHRHILRRARTQVRAFFSHVAPAGGDENPRPGFDNWRSQLDRLRACERAAPTKTPGAFLNNACVGPAGARPRDGPSNGERSESIPPHRHILRRARTQVRAFFSHVAPAGGDENPRPGFDEWQRHPDRTKKTNLMILSHFVLQGLVKQK